MKAIRMAGVALVSVGVMALAGCNGTQDYSNASLGGGIIGGSVSGSPFDPNSTNVIKGQLVVDNGVPVTNIGYVCQGGYKGRIGHTGNVADDANMYFRCPADDPATVSTNEQSSYIVFYLGEQNTIVLGRAYFPQKSSLPDVLRLTPLDIAPTSVLLSASPSDSPARLDIDSTAGQRAVNLEGLLLSLDSQSEDSATQDSVANTDGVVTIPNKAFSLVEDGNFTVSNIYAFNGQYGDTAVTSNPSGSTSMTEIFYGLVKRPVTDNPPGLGYQYRSEADARTELAQAAKATAAGLYEMTINISLPLYQNGSSNAYLVTAPDNILLAINREGYGFGGGTIYEVSPDSNTSSNVAGFDFNLLDFVGLDHPRFNNGLQFTNAQGDTEANGWPYFSAQGVLDASNSLTMVGRVLGSSAYTGETDSNNKTDFQLDYPSATYSFNSGSMDKTLFYGSAFAQVANNNYPLSFASGDGQPLRMQKTATVSANLDTTVMQNFQYGQDYELTLYRADPSQTDDCSGGETVTLADSSGSTVTVPVCYYPTVQRAGAKVPVTIFGNGDIYTDLNHDCSAIVAQPDGTFTDSAGTPQREFPVGFVTSTVPKSTTASDPAVDSVDVFLAMLGPASTSADYAGTPASTTIPQYGTRLLGRIRVDTGAISLPSDDTFAKPARWNDIYQFTKQGKANPPQTQDALNALVAEEGYQTQVVYNSSGVPTKEDVYPAYITSTPITTTGNVGDPNICTP